jgi:uncharacterized protein involved in exopolysaccharide biosynthesis
MEKSQQNLSAGGMETLAREMIAVLWARKWLALAIFLSVTGAGLMVTLLIAPTYESSMKILVSRERADQRVSPGEARNDNPQGDISDEEFNSEIEIIQSRQVLEAVVRELNLERAAIDAAPKGMLPDLKARFASFYRSLHNQAEPTMLERTIRSLSENLEVVSVKKSRIIKVTFRDSDPERAAKLLTALYRKYSDHHLKLRQSSQAALVFRQQTEAFRDKLDDATTALKKFDARNGVASVASQKELLIQQYYQTQSQANSTRTEISETEQRIAALKMQMATQPERIETGTTTKYVQALDRMKDELLQLELQRTQLLQKYKSDHRLIRDVEQRIAQAREVIAREEQTPPQEKSVALNDVHRRLMNDLLSAQANLMALREREKSLTALASQYQARLIEFDQKSYEKTELERAKAVNEEAYLLYHKKTQEAEIANALTLEKVANITLADAASPNYKPISPKPVLNLIVFAVVGFFAAIAGAITVEKVNPTVRSEDSVRRSVGLDVLASISDAR